MKRPGRLAPKFTYTGRTRRAARSVSRAVHDLATPRLYPTAPVIGFYWWEGKRNFGDLLTPLVLRHLGIIAARSPIESAAAVGVGSLLQQLPPEFSGAIWGTGQILDEPLSLPRAHPIALRGELTRERLGTAEVTTLGDPGLLLRRIVRPRPKRYAVGIVPHYSHEEAAELTAVPAAGVGRVRVISTTRSPLAVAMDIAQCHTIVTSSLHGLIVADAFGIPALWVRTTQPLYGHDFKFRDHETVARPAAPRGVDVADLASLAEVPRRAVAADAAAIEGACSALVASVEPLVEATAARRTSPLAVPALRGLDIGALRLF